MHRASEVAPSECRQRRREKSLHDARKSQPPRCAELAFHAPHFHARQHEAEQNFHELKAPFEIGFSIISYINEHLALMLPYLLHKTNALSLRRSEYAERK